MRSNNLIFIAGILSILLTDTLLFLQIKQYLHHKWQIFAYSLYSLLFILIVTACHIAMPLLKGPTAYYWIGTVIGILFLFYTPKLIYIIISILARLCSRVSRKVGFFLQVLALITGGACFLFLLYSITIGRYNYKINTVTIEYADLPASFDRLKIVQITDLHLGSYAKHYKGISKLVREVNNLHPDLIFFTGDMINNFASEMDPWIDILKQLNAKQGKFAVTGNHDYGDYTHWDSPQARINNLEQFFKNMRTADFQMLNNSHIPLIINQDTIYIIGVENWGNPPFPRYGRLAEAMPRKHETFNILLSHDPVHWRAEVLNYNIPLTLSGHTHAMQAGFQIRHHVWSPAKYVYTEYYGLYNKNKQYLYVSSGQGYLGFPGRIGLRPEITELILIRKNIR